MIFAIAASMHALKVSFAVRVIAVETLPSSDIMALNTFEYPGTRRDNYLESVSL